MTENRARLMIQGGALLAALGAGLAIGSATSSGEAGDLADAAPVDSGVRHVDKRLDVQTDVEVQPGVSVTATGKVALGSRLVVLESCVGNYDANTSICVLSPGPWELHSGCYERTGIDDGTTCEVTVRNAGRVPLKFAGYVEVAAP